MHYSDCGQWFVTPSSMARLKSAMAPSRSPFFRLALPRFLYARPYRIKLEGLAVARNVPLKLVSVAVSSAEYMHAAAALLGFSMISTFSRALFFDQGIHTSPKVSISIAAEYPARNSVILTSKPIT
jgi:hypothetical protein